MKIKICAIENGTFRFFQVDDLGNIISKPVTMQQAMDKIKDSPIKTIYELKEVEGEPMLVPAVTSVVMEMFVWDGCRYFYDEGTLYVRTPGDSFFFPVIDHAVIQAIAGQNKRAAKSKYN